MPPRQLKPGLFLITGGGANTVVRVTPEGLIVVDVKNPGDEQYNGLMTQIKTVSQAPVKYVVNTQHHPDHVGNNQKFIDAGAQVERLQSGPGHVEGGMQLVESVAWVPLKAAIRL